MKNAFSKEFYEAPKQEPPYTPFAIPRLREQQWPPPLSRERAAKFWRESIARKASGPTQKVSLQSWAPYIIRFFLAGDL